MKKNFYKPMLDKIPMQEPIKLKPQKLTKKEKELLLPPTKCRFF